MEEKEICPGCANQCPKDALCCGKGRHYLTDGQVVQDDNGKHKHDRKHGHDHKHHFESMDIDERLHKMMCRCGHILKHQSGEKSSQDHVLRLLSRQETIPQKELLEILEVKAGSLSELLSKMEQQELIVRTQNEQDKRGVDIRLSVQGKSMVMAHKDERHQQIKDLFAVLEEQDKEALEKLLGKLMKSWKPQFHRDHHRKNKKQHSM